MDNAIDHKYSFFTFFSAFDEAFVCACVVWHVFARKKILYRLQKKNNIFRKKKYECNFSWYG